MIRWELSIIIGQVADENNRPMIHRHLLIVDKQSRCAILYVKDNIQRVMDRERREKGSSFGKFSDTASFDS